MRPLSPSHCVLPWPDVHRYEREGRARKTIPAQKVWFAVLESQIETGNPYMLFKVRLTALPRCCTCPGLWQVSAFAEAH